MMQRRRIWRGFRRAVALTAAAVAARPVLPQSTATPLPAPQGPRLSHGAVSYVAPDGWTVHPGGNGITVLNGPVKPEDQPCEIRMLAPMAAQPDLATQGAAIVQTIANMSRLGPYTDHLGRDVRLSREEGVSGTGWAYVDLSGQLGQSGVTARVLMARMGDQVLPILGFSKTWNCLGNQAVRDNDVWALLFHSLQLPGYTRDSSELAHELVGMWSSASGGAGVSLIFSPNGRFASVAVYQSYAVASNGTVWETNRSWQGDGPYSVHGDLLHTENPHGSDVEKNATRYFSIVRMPNDNAPGGYDYALLIVERSSTGSATWGFNPTSGNFVIHMKKSNPGKGG